MGHHYVPIRYLSGFARNSRLSVFEKPLGRVFRSQPSSIANEKGLYTEELESQLNNQIEQPANWVLDKISKRGKLDRAEQEALALYIVTMWKRVPNARSRVMGSVPEVVDEVTDELIRDINNLKAQDEITDERREWLLSEAARVREKLKIEPPPQTWWQTIVPEQSVKIAEVMLRMNWAFITDATGNVLTSDNPVYFFPWAGIGRAESELVFPVDQSTVLLATHEAFPTCTYFTGKGIALREINRRIVGNAERQVFASSSFDWVPKLIRNGGGPRTRLRVRG